MTEEKKVKKGILDYLYSIIKPELFTTLPRMWLKAT